MPTQDYRIDRVKVPVRPGGEVTAATYSQLGVVGTYVTAGVAQAASTSTISFLRSQR